MFFIDIILDFAKRRSDDVTGGTFGDKGVNVRIPFEIPPKGVKDTNETGCEMFFFYSIGPLIVLLCTAYLKSLGYFRLSRYNDNYRSIVMAFPTHIVAAAGYVFDKGGNMVIIKTLNRGYDTTGGQIEEGEDLEAGVLREIMEESGECRTSEESSEVLWVPREKVLDYITSPTLRYRFEKILNFDGKITYASDITRPEFKVISERYI